MKALTAAELLKLRSTRTLGWLLVGTLAMVLVSIVATIPSTASTNNVTNLDNPALLARVVGISFLWPQLTITLLGVLSYTQEVRYGTITSTFLVEPKRYGVLAAKSVALAVVSAVMSGATLVFSTVSAIALIAIRHGNAVFGTEFWQVAAAGFLAMALSSLMGLAVGALFRNQIVAVTATLVWLSFGEHLLLEALPQVAQWTIAGLTAGLLQLGAEATTSGTLLSAPTAGLLLLGYTAAAAAIAGIVAPRRDVL